MQSQNEKDREHLTSSLFCAITWCVLKINELRQKIWVILGGASKKVYLVLSCQFSTYQKPNFNLGGALTKLGAVVFALFPFKRQFLSSCNPQCRYVCLRLRDF